jgi:hypothetical protein
LIIDNCVCLALVNNSFVNMLISNSTKLCAIFALEKAGILNCAVNYPILREILN